MYILLCLCYYYCNVYRADLTYISLLIIFCIIVYVTNKILNLDRLTITFIFVCVCVSLSLSVCVLEGDTGVNSQTSPVPLPQKCISSRPNPTKKLGENPVPFHSRKNDLLLFFFAEICQLQ